MSDSMRELYQETILDHYKRPRNYGAPEHETLSAQGYNPLCGDKVKVYVTLDGDNVTNVMFEGSGCAICTASSSMMTEQVKGLTVTEAENLFDTVRSMFVSDPETEPPDGIGDLIVLAGVREHPIRIKCATLPWHALKAALSSQPVVSTE